ncbi:alpha-mannosidase [Liquorilactobacillus mali]|nr:alpha-mannosidase [Liquorilactobacillus mali]EJF00655.1 alpha-mannosidase [Liquorilactobacillus mali KCTC 3596 = DSM 20444]MDV7757892.1 alpha-mannosidase [Liquorilactobacillus mali]QFQ74034.1 alpha-mannosidase [Liquorilactobacillus mali]
MVKAYLVNHTHWDREWYFTVMDSQVLADQVFTEILDELETHPEANFCLDGQTSILDEYVDTHPENLERIRKLVKEDRLFVGPWYTQTDALIPDAESILRNLYIGISEATEKYGKAMMVGYLPDTFGFNAQMPMLLNQVGIDSILFWRGTNFNTQVSSPYFKWRALGQDSIIAANFPFGYFTGQIGLDAKEKMLSFISDRYDPNIKFLEEHGNNSDVLIPSGIDQMNIVHNIAETVRNINERSKYETEISTYQEFINILRKKALPDYSGELRLPTYSRIHRTIGSVRQSIKKQNFEIEQKILKRVEPLMIIAESAGIEIGKGMLTLLWKKLLESQAHDSLGGSVSDNVAEDIMHRFKEANELADGIENLIKKKIGDSLNLNKNELLLFNTTPQKFNGFKKVSIMARSKNIKFENVEYQSVTVDKHYPIRKHVLKMTEKGREYFDEPEYFSLTCTIKVQLDPLGYTVIKFHDISDQGEPYIPQESNYISTKNIKFEFNDGKVSFTNGTEVIEDFISLLESGNDGDTYDYSPIEGEKEQVLPFSNCSVTHHSDIFENLIINGEKLLPENLVDRVNGDDNKKFVYKLVISLNKISQEISFKLIFDNNIESHRLRLRINPNRKIFGVKAGIQGGIVDVTNERIPKDWKDKFDEKPVNIYNFDKLLNVNGNNNSLSFFPRGLKEFEFDNKYLYITLLATTGQLGKPNLAWRPGRASGDTTNEGHIMMSTPMAQEKGNWEFFIGMKLNKIDESHNLLSREINKSFDQSVGYQKQTLNLFINRLDNKIWPTEINYQIPRNLSLLAIDQKLVVSALYPSKEKKRYLIRILNDSNKIIDVEGKIDNKVTRVDIFENNLDEGTIIKPHSYATFKIKNIVNFKREELIFNNY